MESKRADQRRQKILQTARDLFLNQGYEKTSLDQIVAKTGGSKQTIYRYFGNKKGLFAAVVEPIIEAAELSFPLDRADVVDYETALKTFAHSYLMMLLHEDTLSLSRALIAHSLVDKQAAKMFLAQGPERYTRNLIGYLERLVAVEAMKITNTQVVAQQLLGALRGNIHQQAIFDVDYCPSPEEIELVVNIAIDAFIKCYRYADG